MHQYIKVPIGLYSPVELKTGLKGAGHRLISEKPAEKYAEPTQVKCFLMALFTIL